MPPEDDQKRSPSSSSPDSGPGPWLEVAGLAVALAAFVYQVHLFWSYLVDDAFITLRYSRFLASGEGPFFNPGEHVEGYTNFLFMVLLAGVIHACGPEAAPMLAKGLSAVFGGIALVVTFCLASRLLRRADGACRATRLWALAAVAVVAVSPAFAVNSASGLETTLFSLGLVTAVFLSLDAVERGGWAGAGLAWSAVLLTRPEGALLFAVVWTTLAALAMRDGRSVPAGLRSPQFRGAWIDAVLVTSVYLAHLAFRWLTYDGEWLPNTYYAKTGGFMGAPPWTYIGEAVLPFVLWLPGLALAVWGLWRRCRRAGEARRVLPVAAVATVGCLLPVVTGTDWMLGWRLVTPYLPLVAVTAVAGWSGLARGRPTLAALAFLLLVVPGLWIAQAELRSDLATQTRLSAERARVGHERVAHWLCDEPGRAPGPLALMDIGVIGYRCMEREVIDIVGLTDRAIGKSPGRFMDKRYDVGYVLDRRPAYIVLLHSSTNRTPTSTNETKVPPIRAFRFWTPIENRLYRHPRFHEHCVEERTPGEGLAWDAALARQLGAVAIFPAPSFAETDYPFVVFRCRFD